MEIKFLNKSGNKNLLLFFAGWGMDERPFEHLIRDDYDVAICFDYSSLCFDFSIVDGYEKFDLLAWSMGVWAASVIFSDAKVSPCVAVAVNGTEDPISDLHGIPVNIFRGTLDNLSESNLMKFNRRMCDSMGVFEMFCQKFPLRSFESKYSELSLIWDSAFNKKPLSMIWDWAVVSVDDKIFPSSNQKCYWESKNISVKLIRNGHYIFDQFSSWNELLSREGIVVL